MSTVAVSRPHATEFAQYHQAYIDLVQGDDIRTILEKSVEEQVHFLKSIPAEKENYAYAEGKWTIKELIQHMVDAERVLSYRALRIARGDTFSLPGYDHDRYVLVSEAKNRKLDDLVEELKHTRTSTAYLFKSFSDECY